MAMRKKSQDIGGPSTGQGADSPHYPWHPKATQNFVGHDDVLGAILSRLRAGTLPSGLLLEGPRGIGKATFAYHLVHHIMSGQGHDGDLFRHRPQDGIYHRMQAGTLENFFALEKQPNQEDGKTPREIPLDDFKQAIQFLQLSAFEGKARFVLLDGVTDLPNRHSNMLLKSLEEPRGNTHFILIAHQGGRVLPTLRSRTQRFLFRPLNPNDYQAVLGDPRFAPLRHQGGDYLNDPWISIFAEGSPGNGIIAAKLGGGPFYDQFLKTLQTLCQGKTHGVSQFVGETLSRAHDLPAHEGWDGLMLVVTFFLNRLAKGPIAAPLSDLEASVIGAIRQQSTQGQRWENVRGVLTLMAQTIPFSLDAPSVFEAILWRLARVP